MTNETDVSEAVKSKQIKRILEYLRINGSISAYEATTKLSIGSPRKRFSDMRRRGFTLESKWEEGVNKYGEKWRAKRYYIV